jgi:hypothetical protein
LFDPSLYPAVAVNCSTDPTLSDAAVGEIDSDIKVAFDVTVSVAWPLIALNEAVMFAAPPATPRASPGFACPVDWIDATVASEEDHVAEDVTSVLDPSLYFAVAVNCTVAPMFTVVAAEVIDTEVRAGSVVPPLKFEDEPPPHPAKNNVAGRRSEDTRLKRAREHSGFDSCTH